MGIVSELRRRNVLRMALLYLGAAWLIMQVVDLLIDRGPLPESIGPITLTVLAIGFPIALIISWFYELTPEGISLDTDEESAESTTGFTGRRVDFVIISVLAAAVLVFAYDKWWMGPPPERSVAVLPFVNMSAGEDNAYFSDGLADTMLHMLAQVPNLRVPARTSSFEFRDFEGDISEIGRRLNVSAVLEGSVQLQGDKVRVIAQLIDVSDGFHLWSRTFDRNFKDIFAIQDDIAREVVAALKVSMSDETAERLDYGGTDNTDAYTEYLLAIDSMNPVTSKGQEKAMRHLQKAIEIDPTYARAHAMLGFTYVYHLEVGKAQAIAAARNAASRALDIAPDLPEALAVLGRAELRDGNKDLGKQLLRQAVDVGPNNILALNAYANLAYSEMRKDESEAILRRIIELNPLDESGYDGLGWSFLDQGRFSEALELGLRFREVMPDSAHAARLVAACHTFMGEYAASIRLTHEIAALDPNNTLRAAEIPLSYLMVDMVEEARYWFDRVAEPDPENPSVELSSLLMNYYLQQNEEESYQLARQLLTRPDYSGVYLQIPLLVLTEYGAKLGRNDSVLELLDNLYPHLFDDPPRDHGLDLETYWSAVALLQSGDVDRGTVLMKAFLKELDRDNEVSPVHWLSITGRLALGDIDAAMAKLKQFRPTMYHGMNVFAQVTLKHSKQYAPIRDEPEFIALLDEYRRNAAEQRRLVQEMDIH